MKYYQLLGGVLIALILQSCAGTKLLEEGNTAYQAGNYQDALTNLEHVIKEQENKGKAVDSVVYYRAGMAAWKLEKREKAQQYFETAETYGYSSPEMYAHLATIYKSIDNLSKEIGALSDYHEHYPKGKAIDKINVRLFETYVESENWSLAEDLWPELREEDRNDTALLSKWFKVNKELGNKDVCDSLATRLLEKDSNHIAALEWNAKKYFNKAEDLYVSEMKAYDENRTRKQYRQLLKAWDKIWPDFRKSRDYYEKLYKLNQQAKYAKYLEHIYMRMDKDDKADYWGKRAE